MGRMKYRRLAGQIAISIAAAAITPAAGAGLVEGVKVAATTVDDATSLPTTAAMNLPATVQDEAGAPADPSGMSNNRIATAAPRRLSALAGGDTTAWANAKSFRAERKPGAP